METQNPNNNNSRREEEEETSSSPLGVGVGVGVGIGLGVGVGVGEEEGISEHWEVMAREWLSDGRSLIRPDEVETWEKDANQNDHSQARFQRTDRWLPVYSWLESVDSEEVVKSKDILDWLASNPEVKDDLYARHSRYHLMHYIKKCHVKILKRKERKKGLQIIDKVNMTLTSKIEERERPASLPCNLLNNMPTNSDLYFGKRNEALRKYEILLELESQLSTLFPKPEAFVLWLPKSFYLGWYINWMCNALGVLLMVTAPIGCKPRTSKF